MGADGEKERPTMASVSHENPRTGSTLGEIFRRGPTVADGGTPTDERPADLDESMADVDHTARRGDDSAVERVWCRGREGRP